MKMKNDFGSLMAKLFMMHVEAKYPWLFPLTGLVMILLWIAISMFAILTIINLDWWRWLALSGVVLIIYNFTMKKVMTIWFEMWYEDGN